MSTLNLIWLLNCDYTLSWLVDLSSQTGVSNWLMVLQITEFWFELSKQQFWDSIRLQYGWKMTNLPITCSCWNKFDIQASMICEKGGFISIKCNDLPDVTTNMMSGKCKDTKTEPNSTYLSGEELHGRTSNNSNQLKVEIRYLGDEGNKRFST